MRTIGKTSLPELLQTYLHICLSKSHANVDCGIPAALHCHRLKKQLCPPVVVCRFLVGWGRSMRRETVTLVVGRYVFCLGVYPSLMATVCKMHFGTRSLHLVPRSVSRKREFYTLDHFVRFCGPQFCLVISTHRLTAMCRFRLWIISFCGWSKWT
jgi:hypothetical protein